MKKIVLTLLGASALMLVVYSCSENKPAATDSKKDSVANNCETGGEPILYPNETKPMAMMMRTMVQNAVSMREQILNKEQLDSLKYPFIRFYLVEPTDPKVLEPVFYENARLFQDAYLELFKHPDEQVKYYNLVIGKCVNCHERYCSGPLKRIRKLLITP